MGDLGQLTEDSAIAQIEVDKIKSGLTEEVSPLVVYFPRRKSLVPTPPYGLYQKISEFFDKYFGIELPF